MIRVPNEFADTIDNISKRMKVSRTKFLKEDGIRIFKNADALSDIFGNIFKRRKL